MWVIILLFVRSFHTAAIRQPVKGNEGTVQSISGRSVYFLQGANPDLDMSDTIFYCQNLILQEQKFVASDFSCNMILKGVPIMCKK